MVKFRLKKGYISYIDRSNGILKEEQSPNLSWLRWLYSNPLGRASLFLLVKRKFLSSFYGRLMDKSFSRKYINWFVDSYNVDLSDAVKSISQFTSFNDFFTRKLKPGSRIFSSVKSVVSSPVDSKVLVFDKISDFDSIYIKGKKFSLDSFFNNSSFADKFRDGSFCVFRLDPHDYHRFHFPFDGRLVSSFSIQGFYYSVSPIALREYSSIFFENRRSYSLLKSSVFGEVAYCEVGATLVGGIVQTFGKTVFKKGDEKGFFKFGGSTVVLFFQKDSVKFDSDLLKNSLDGLETSIKAGESIARSIN